jgi:dTDP-4-amino-4,6-dideoxygalactose transaminase
MTIPFYNISRLHEKHREEILRITDHVFSEGKVVEGKEVAECEDFLKHLCGRRHAIAVNSCTDALYFSLLTAEVSEGDEVIVPAISFIATAGPVVRAGARAVFADTLPDGNINLTDAEARVSKKTKAIIPVHLYGRMADTAALKQFGQRHNLAVIEDAAQALGSSYNGIPAGQTGFCSCFSFDPSKIIGAFGTGGMVLTDNDEAAEKISMWRAQGKNKKTGNFTEQGYNSRLSTLQAALILMQLKEKEKIIESRNRIAARYNRLLSGLPVELTQLPSEGEVWNFHKYPLLTNRRDELKTFLAGKGVETQIHYTYLLPGQPLFGADSGKYPCALQISQKTLSLPIYPELTDKETDYICQSIHDFFNENPL